MLLGSDSYSLSRGRRGKRSGLTGFRASIKIAIATTIIIATARQTSSSSHNASADTRTAMLGSISAQFDGPITTMISSNAEPFDYVAVGGSVQVIEHGPEGVFTTRSVMRNIPAPIADMALYRDELIIGHAEGIDVWDIGDASRPVMSERLVLVDGVSRVLISGSVCIALVGRHFAFFAITFDLSGGRIEDYNKFAISGPSSNIDGGRFAVSTVNDGVVVYEVKNSDEIVRVGAWALERKASTLHLNGDDLFVGMDSDVVIVAGIINGPIHERTRFPVQGLVQSFDFVNQRLLIGTTIGLYVADVSSDVVLQRLRQIDGMQGVQLVRGTLNGILCISAPSSIFRIWDIDTTRIQIAIELQTFGRAQDIDIDDDILYVANGEGGILIADIADAERPRVVSSTPINGAATRIAVASHFATVGTADGTVALVDVMNTARPVVRGYTQKLSDETCNIRFPDLGWCGIRDIASNDTHAFIAAGSGGLCILELSRTKDFAEARCNRDLAAEVLSVAVLGELVVVTCETSRGTGEILVIDVLHEDQTVTLGKMEYVQPDLGRRPLVTDGRYGFTTSAVPQSVSGSGLARQANLEVLLPIPNTRTVIPPPPDPHYLVAMDLLDPSHPILASFSVLHRPVGLPSDMMIYHNRAWLVSTEGREYRGNELISIDLASGSDDGSAIMRLPLPGTALAITSGPDFVALALDDAGIAIVVPPSPTSAETPSASRTPESSGTPSSTALRRSRAFLPSAWR